MKREGASRPWMHAINCLDICASVVFGSSTCLKHCVASLVQVNCPICLFITAAQSYYTLKVLDGQWAQRVLPKLSQESIAIKEKDRHTQGALGSKPSPFRKECKPNIIKECTRIRVWCLWLRMCAPWCPSAKLFWGSMHPTSNVGGSGIESYQDLPLS